MLNHIEGVIFDFNGVLLWDTHLHVIAWRELSAKLRGTPFTDHEIEEMVHGRPNKIIFEYLLQKPLEHTQLTELANHKEQMYRELCLQEISQQNITLSPGAEKLLDFIVDRSIPHTIATGAPKQNLDFYVQHFNLERWFDLPKIVYDDGILPGKPFPDVYLKAANHIGVPPQHCIVIEDAVSGITAAHRAGIGQIYAIGPAEKHPWLRTIKGVHQVIETLQELPLK